MRSLAAALAAAFSLAACATAEPPMALPSGPPVTTWIVGADGRAIGQAVLTPAPQGVLIRLEFTQGALPPGWHGAHLHEVGTCADFGAGFTGSGSHVGHAAAGEHGLLNPAGPEQGDLPNLFATPGSIFGAEFFSPWLVLGPTAIDGRMPLLDADGAALVIHANADDHRTQPIGGAGPRIGCAVITAAP